MDAEWTGLGHGIFKKGCRINDKHVLVLWRGGVSDAPSNPSQEWGLCLCSDFPSRVSERLHSLEEDRFGVAEGMGICRRLASESEQVWSVLESDIDELIAFLRDAD
jgi:hypothetical protein